MTASKGEVTHLLDAWSDGDPRALEALMPLVVDDLRRIAKRYFEREAPGHTLQPTALVNEVYLRFAGRRKVQWKSRAQFFAAAAEVMRHLLVDHARQRQAQKRGGDAVKVSLDDVFGLAVERDPDLIVLDDALKRLREMDPRQCRVVELKCFAGLTVEEIGETLDLGPTTVKAEWRTARAWLLRALRRE